MKKPSHITDTLTFLRRMLDPRRPQQHPHRLPLQLGQASQQMRSLSVLIRASFLVVARASRTLIPLRHERIAKGPAGLVLLVK
ncbi:hypothetical protein PC118_g8072 [Phytophthora cactorum]|uniref:Uncharacterized protein n=2 Tax=Phytophthora cactorum TaxID=29920 RepID=A0A8T1G093_9STRA|nr:hypothetical protein PC118_g8072 [Phytophthora cactorum]KAG3073132.1 hypothetical protein PC121_g8741 [Phytophthora cactorum]KAG4057133.1 hypothetical protein PC123_g7844 [Phytophthora cactorum]